MRLEVPELASADGYIVGAHIPTWFLRVAYQISIKNGLLKRSKYGRAGLRCYASPSLCLMIYQRTANWRFSSPFPSLEVLYKFKLTGTPGKSILGLRVSFPPSAATPPHTHHGAFIAVNVLAGSVLNKMNDDPMTIKKVGFPREDAESNSLTMRKVGDGFNEAPGCRHLISANASDTEEAVIQAVLILESEKMDALIEKDGAMGLVLIDEEYREAVAEQRKKLQAK